MGKGTITANLGEGLYTVTVDSGQARADASILVLQIQIGDLDAQIATTTSEKNALDAEIVVLEAAYQAQVDAYVAAGPNAPTDALENALLALKLKVSDRDEKVTELQRLQADRSSSARRLSELQALNITQSVSAWCVDYTTDAAGDVATIEIPGEPSRPFLIAPGGRAPTAADGKLLAREVMTGPQAYFNAAILPGWQKFKPTYRRGVITAINFVNNTADVTLYDDRSSADALVINQTSTLTNVPIVYQDCNADVFELGDNCVVEFQNRNWSNPKLIGFVSNPKACANWYIVAYIDVRGSDAGVSSYKAQAQYDASLMTIKSDFTYQNNWSTTRYFTNIREFSDGSEKIFVSFREGSNYVSIQKSSNTIKNWYTGADQVYAVTAKKYGGTWWIFAVTRYNNYEKVYRFNFSDSTSTALLSTYQVSVGQGVTRFSTSANGGQIVAPFGYYNSYSGYSAIIVDSYVNNRTLNFGYNLYTFIDNTVTASYDNRDSSTDLNALMYFSGNALQKFVYSDFYPNIGSSLPSYGTSSNYSDSINSTDTGSASSSASASYTIDNTFGGNTLTNFSGSVDFNIKYLYDPNLSIEIDVVYSATYQVGGTFGLLIDVDSSYKFNGSTLASYSRSNIDTSTVSRFLPSLTEYNYWGKGSLGPYVSNAQIRYLPNGMYGLIDTFFKPDGTFYGLKNSNNTKIQALLDAVYAANTRPNKYISSVYFALEFNPIF